MVDVVRVSREDTPLNIGAKGIAAVNWRSGRHGPGTRVAARTTFQAQSCPFSCKQWLYKSTWLATLARWVPVGGTQSFICYNSVQQQPKCLLYSLCYLLPRGQMVNLITTTRPDLLVERGGCVATYERADGIANDDGLHKTGGEGWRASA